MLTYIDGAGLVTKIDKKSFLREELSRHVWKTVVPRVRRVGEITKQLPLTGITPMTGEDYNSNLGGTYSHSLMGHFYELVSQGIYGGNVFEDFKFSRTATKREKSVEGLESKIEELFRAEEMEELDQFPVLSSAKPDIVNDRDKLIGESKAVGFGSVKSEGKNHCNFFDGQIGRYITMQATFPQASVYFAIYRHNFCGIRSEKRPRELIFPDLAKSIGYTVVLPLSLVIGLKEAYKFPEKILPELRNLLFRRHDPQEDKGDYTKQGYFPACTCINCPTFNSLFHSPKHLIKLFGLDPEGYTFYREMSPKTFFVDGLRVKRFPILRIKDRNHKERVEKFLEKQKFEIPF